jgi:hypothetical protein
MTLQSDFQDSIDIQKEIDKSFDPLVEKFNELKDILDANFSKMENSGILFWKNKKKIPALFVKIKDKICVDGQSYLEIHIAHYRFLMSIGSYGELKDKVYFIEPTCGIYGHFGKLIHNSHECYEWAVSTRYFYERRTKTTVQLFSYLIKEYKEYLNG